MFSLLKGAPDPVASMEVADAAGMFRLLSYKSGCQAGCHPRTGVVTGSGVQPDLILDLAKPHADQESMDAHF